MAAAIRLKSVGYNVEIFEATIFVLMPEEKLTEL